MVERLHLYGETPVIVSPAQRFERLASSHPRPVSRCFKIRPDHALDYEQLLEHLFDSVANPPLRGVIHLWSLDMAPMSAHAFMGEQSIASLSVLYLVQALSQVKETPRTFLVTRGAQAIGEGATSILPRLCVAQLLKSLTLTPKSRLNSLIIQQ